MHTMTLIKEHEGTEEWMCFVCSRHLLVSWDPIFEKTVLLEGDPLAKHTGLKNNKHLHQTYLTGNGEETLDDWLLPWIMWMEEIGFEDLWDRDLR